MMNVQRRKAVLAALLVVLVPSLRAQTAADPSGHWEGAIQAPDVEVRIEVDLTRNGNGELAGTISIPANTLKGLPLSSVTVENGAVTFDVRLAGGGRFQGEILADGKSLSGVFAGQAGTAPFSLTRTSDARIEAPPKSAPIGEEVQGMWNGTLEVDGGRRLLLKMSNLPDGTSTGSVVSIDEGGLEIPVAIIQEGARLTLDMRMVGGSYTGALNGAGTELVGTYTTPRSTLPLTFRRSAGK
jgi:hypothetical protein